MQLQIQHKSVYAYTGGKAFNPNLPTVLLVHGAQNDHSVWAMQSRYLAHHGFSVLALDLPGHGRSQGPALHSVEVMAKWLLEVIELSGVQQAFVAGHSMGSLIALEAASLAPERIQKLALLGTAFPMKVSDALLFASQNHEQSAIDMVNIFSHSSNAHKPSCPGPGFSVMNSSMRLMQRISAINPEQVFFNDFTACNEYKNGENAAQKVTCPTLFLLAKQDMMTPVKASASLSNAITNKQIRIIENCGHSMMTEQADAVLDALHQFFKT
ncbi:alpha/beta hydrolase [Undibacterium cyanobacteriorum]|uniref:Alpha/beta hydrolase n=1 Tax=Undibacterium cyanobacteriorum TaxID=3073561 RepID=A0ABY9RPS3_9BURK|nr:alpha/beta hydrolase [Undibacterium sp. 20NA77.5]WMW82452.1 alpha/beta hydrolase [Undibacterium sp. 20NA77.5]